MTEEEFTPKRRRAAVATAEKPADDTPAESKTVTDTSSKVQTDAIRRGWSAATETFNARSNYAQALKVDEDVQIIKFLEDGPYASYARHWVEREGEGGRSVNRPYTCLTSVGKDCPLCDIGQKTQAVSAFNVALITDDGHAVLRSWDVGVRNFGVLKKHSTDSKTGPLSKCYYAVSKSGKGSATAYQIVPIRSTDTLEAEYERTVTDELLAEIEGLDLYDSSIITVPAESELQEIALEIAGDESYA